MRLRKEIGSEFWEVPTKTTKNGLFPENTYWFLSGRSALQAIIEDIKKSVNIQTIAMPDWCCDSMIIPFRKAGIDIVFYQALKSIDNLKADALLIMDYFGYTGYSTVTNFDGIVIRDLTHSILSKKYDDADYYFGSLRKWAGFWTGGYAWGFKHNVDYVCCESGYTDLRKTAMSEKDAYISLKSDSKDYLRIFEEAEALLENIGICRGDDGDVNRAVVLDIEGIKSARRQNALILLSELSDSAIFPIMDASDCPMFVPIRTNNRNELRRFLIQHEIYCPIHWPITGYHHLSEETRKLVGEELSLVCDQRYSRDDMYHIIEVVKMFERK